jgi:hypothetical protein
MNIRKKDKKTTNHRLSAESTGRSRVRWILSIILISIVLLQGDVARPAKKNFQVGFTNTRTHDILGSNR